MQTNLLKKFATEARTSLKNGVKVKIQLLGYDSEGNVANDMIPRQVQGGCIWNNQTMSETWFDQWNSLNERIRAKGVNEVYEETAYTWFNRLVAIRILQKNGLCEPILDFTNGTRTPVIVDNAKRGIVPASMSEDARQKLMNLLDDDTKESEHFALLITAWCHSNPIIQACFGGISDYTELLLPNNILSEGGFIDILNHTEFITDEDYQTSELIGWLYQFYISERKDEVFASFSKGKKADTTEEIAAATQIFTPNWIVKYMVQNTVGRIYLDNNPYAASEFKDKWKYLVEPSEPTPDDCILKLDSLEKYKSGDLACGSGHILNEIFDIFYDLYIYEGYSRKEAIESIFKNNLTGIDLDSRAKQLATFSLLLRACQKDASFADAHVLPHVLTMPKPWDSEKYGDPKDFFHHYFKGEESKKNVEELESCFNLMQNADSLGSIMKFNISDTTRLLIKQTTDYWCEQSFAPDIISSQIPAFKLILALTEKYHALAMNPPYMGAGNMNSVLTKYVKDNYNRSKADLMSIFMDVDIEHLTSNGKYGMINMHSWMFLSSFELLRKDILLNQQIDILLHLGSRLFDEIAGEVVQSTSFVISKHKPKYGSIFYRLVDGKCCSEKESSFFAKNSFYQGIYQLDFKKINNWPIAYWASDKVKSAFENSLLSSICPVKKGMDTGNNAIYLRFWHEVENRKIGINQKSSEEFSKHNFKWAPYNKGGERKKWYGNKDYVVLWENNGEELEKSTANLRSKHLYFKNSITWNALTTSTTTARLSDYGALFDSAGSSMFPNEKQIHFLLGFINSSCVGELLFILNPTLNYGAGTVGSLPVIIDKEEIINQIVKNCIPIAKSDWDAHETSWDFQTNELIRIAKEVATPIRASVAGEIASEYYTLDLLVMEYKTYWKDQFMKLHENEEELNRQFIEIYGLQDELTPDVPLDEITILQNGEISIENDEIVWHEDVLMKQLISYAVGCMMGRYRLDKPGLHIAHPEPSAEEIASYEYNGERYEIDDDGIMPLMPKDCGFSDNASLRLSDFIRLVFGNDSHVDNLNYIEKKLGKSVEQYFVKDFWKDHKKMYQNKPIYWLFSSKKGAFQVLVYMHRMNSYTVNRINDKYLLPFIETLNNRISELQARESSLSTADNKKLTTLKTQLEECKEYQERLAVYAEKAIGFDLDDGVVVNYAKFGDIVAKIK